MYYITTYMGQFQDEWATKGHTHRNEPRINVIYMGQFKDKWVMGILA